MMQEKKMKRKEVWSVESEQQRGLGESEYDPVEVGFMQIFRWFLIVWLLGAVILVSVQGGVANVAISLGLLVYAAPIMMICVGVIGGIAKWLVDRIMG
jgi:hypothetical protein